MIAMTSGPLHYTRLKSGGYQVVEDWWLSSPLIEGCAARVDGFITQSQGGTLCIHAGYHWDGPSGPTLDTPDFMSASLAHDAGYQLCRASKVPWKQWRKRYDELLYHMCRRAGMPWIRAQWCYWGVRIGGRSSARPQPEVETKVLTAP